MLLLYTIPKRKSTNLVPARPDQAALSLSLSRSLAARLYATLHVPISAYEYTSFSPSIVYLIPIVVRNRIL